MTPRSCRARLGLLATLATTLALSACGGGGGGASGGGSQAAGPIQRGGDLVIVRQEDSQSMDKTTVFANESIWVLEQIMEPLYTVTSDGKGVKPWLATSYELSSDQTTYTFHLRKGVNFSNGKPMTSADVKFSIDEARKATQGWGYLDAAIKDVEAPDPSTVVIHTKYKWSPFLADIALFANGIIPKDYGGETKDQFYQHPIGTGPFVWDHWTKGQELVLKRNPHYWQKGKPYLDSVTWNLVPDSGTRELQLKGGQADIDEFPPFQTINTLKQTPGVVMKLFPSTRTDYMMLNERVKPLADVHVRRAISYAIDRKSIIDSVLFGYAKPANSFMPPQVPFYDANSPGLQFDQAKAKQEMAQSKYPNGFTVELQVNSGDPTEKAEAQIIQQELKGIGINVVLKPVNASVEFTNEQEFKYQMGFSYWTMDIADPDELVTFAVDPGAGAKSFYTDYTNNTVIADTHEAEHTFDKARRQELYSEIQKLAAQDAFMVFLWYSPYRYAFSDKVHGFLVYPTGNFHLEDVWKSK